ncbi:ATPase family AAA domain-containing protein 2-like [Tripterygium wilfordii]|uniref:ATPase family AAA domain-containing protein 2-like n=1 Tax=Tripterygium wilfordii TaxID=458696 RepID=UPI0018F7F7C1|nr:ATPase family AAA domain-containing protein 2-like [Tripterygium wilfordii]
MASRRLFNSKANYISQSPESFNSVTTGSHFEFDEADVYNFNESIQLETKKSILTSLSKKISRKIDKRDRANTVTSASYPVNFRDWSKEDRSRNHQNRGNYDEEDDNSDDNDDDEEEHNSDDDDRIPPHEYLVKVRGASLSVQEGIGRTLKGRDLCRVRDAIWQKTGFED